MKQWSEQLVYLKIQKIMLAPRPLTIFQLAYQRQKKKERQRNDIQTQIAIYHETDNYV